MPLFDPTPENISLAAARLNKGELVAFPTETVYGLGANALDADAVSKIYARKGRPSNNPLIVHVASLEHARTLSSQWPDAAQLLGERFWPGPLTLVVPKIAAIPENVSAGLTTVALRVPAHPIALELLRVANIPLAAPSANRSGQVSPTRAAHVLQSLGEDVWVLDGGACEVGIESTVVDVSGERPVILRPGGIAAREIEAIIGPLSDYEAEGDDSPKPSPGMMSKHYAPKARVHLYVSLTDAAFHAVSLASGQPIGVLSREPTDLAKRFDAREIEMPHEPRAYAHRLYDVLRQLDSMGVALILVEDVPTGRAWDAVRDRLQRAAK